MFELFQFIFENVLWFASRIAPSWWMVLAIATGCSAVWNIIKVRRGERTCKRAVISALMTIYLSAVVMFTFGTRLPDPQYAFRPIPFISYWQAICKNDLYEAFQIFGNILLFVPLGVLLPITWKKESRCTVGVVCKFAFLLSLLIESCQLITKIGCFETDDVINNTFGAVIGYGAIRMIRSIKKKNDRSGYGMDE